MNSNDRNRFLEMMNGAGAIYGKEISKSLLTSYFKILTDYTIDEVYQAFNKHAVDPVHGTFFPKPADIVRHIANTAPRALDSDELAELAWSSIIEQIGRVGPYGSLVLEDKLAIAAVKGMGGWQVMANSTYDQLTWMKKEFFKSYIIYDRTDLDQLPSSLPGIFEIEQHKKQTSNTVNNILAEVQKRLG